MHCLVLDVILPIFQGHVSVIWNRIFLCPGVGLIDDRVQGLCSLSRYVLLLDQQVVLNGLVQLIGTLEFVSKFDRLADDILPCGIDSLDCQCLGIFQ